MRAAVELLALGAIPLAGACTERGPATVGASSAAACFVEIGAEVGLEHVRDRAESGVWFMPDSLSAGGALADFDGDGRLDVYIVDGIWSGGSADPAGKNRLYLQRPDGRFRDVTDSSGVADPGYGMGVAVGDYDADGHPDIYVTNYGPDALYRNDGDGTFTETTRDAGVGDPRWGASAGFVDYDGDGDLDLFVTNYVAFAADMRVTDSGGRPEFPGPACCPGTPDSVYRNDGDGTFTDVSETSGVAHAPGKGLGVAFVDLDVDGRLDVYVANDREPNRGWIFAGNDTFVDRGSIFGVAVNAFGGPEASMGIAAADLSGDGRIDLFLTHFAGETNTLYRSEGAKRYTDATLGSGLGPAGLDFTGFGTEAIDFDLDGDLDLLVVNGRVQRAAERPGAVGPERWRPYAEENLLFVNLGDGEFRRDTERCGTLCSTADVSRGLAAGDVDNDGDDDLLVTEGSGRVRLFRNDCGSGNHWLGLRLVDPRTGGDAIGASARVRTGERVLRRDVAVTRSYLSSGDPRLRFGLGASAAIDEVVVRWPDGTLERHGAPATGRYHTIERSSGVVLETPATAEARH